MLSASATCSKPMVERRLTRPARNRLLASMTTTSICAMTAVSPGTTQAVLDQKQFLSFRPGSPFWEAILAPPGMRRCRSRSPPVCNGLGDPYGIPSPVSADLWLPRRAANFFNRRYKVRRVVVDLCGYHAHCGSDATL